MSETQFTVDYESSSTFDKDIPGMVCSRVNLAFDGDEVLCEFYAEIEGATYEGSPERGRVVAREGHLWTLRFPSGDRTFNAETRRLA